MMAGAGALRSRGSRAARTMDYLPIFVDLKGVDCLVAGGGELAARKVRTLLAAGAAVRVVAPELSSGLRALVDERRVVHLARRFTPRDLDGARLAIAATGAPETNAAIAEAAAARAVLVNVVDTPALCTFVMPSILDRSPLVAAISSGGAAPVLARLARSRLETVLPESLGPLARLAGEMREEVRARISEPRGRRRFWEGALVGAPARLASAGRTGEALEALRSALAAWDGSALAGRIAIIELPTGDPEMLTVAAIRALQSADVVARGRGIGEDVAAYCRRDARQVRIADDALVAGEPLASALARYATAGEHVAVITADAPRIESALGDTPTSVRIPTAR